MGQEVTRGPALVQPAIREPLHRGTSCREGRYLALLPKAWSRAEKDAIRQVGLSVHMHRSSLAEVICKVR